MELDGEPVSFDPTNPMFIKRLKDGIRRMLSSEKGCYNADGFKIDGTNSQPAGCDLKNHGSVWGHELLRQFLGTLYDESKKIKEDALISVFTANPYYHDVCDMVRLGDLYTAEGDPQEHYET